MIVVLGFVLGSVETIFDNAATALVPEMVDGDFLVRANSWLISSQTLSSQFVGPALGGILFAGARFVPVAIDALSFLAAAVLVATLPARKKSASEHPETTNAGLLRSEIMEGLGFLKRQPVLLFRARFSRRLCTRPAEYSRRFLSFTSRICCTLGVLATACSLVRLHWAVS